MNSFKSLQSSLSVRKLKAALSRLTYLWKPLLGLSSLVCLTARFACFVFLEGGGGAVIVFFLCHQAQNDSSSLLLATVLLHSC